MEIDVLRVETPDQSEESSMRNRMLFAIALSMLMQASILGQERTAVGGPAKLLWLESVQKELRLTEEQTAKGKEISRTVHEQFAGQIEELKSLEEAEKQERSRELRKRIGEKTNEALSQALNSEQSKRLKQINLQILGVQALNEPAVQAYLKLTNDQKEALKSVGADAARQIREALPTTESEYKAAGKKIENVRKAAMDKAMAVLSSKQKAAWQKLVGRPFDITLDELFVVH
jgi:hypothetical protein